MPQAHAAQGDEQVKVVSEEEPGLDLEDATQFQRVSLKIGVAALGGDSPRILIPQNGRSGSLAYVLFNNPEYALPGSLVVEAIDGDGTKVFRDKDGRIFANQSEAVSLSVGQALAMEFPGMVGVLQQSL